MEFEPGTARSDITERPTKPRGSWRVQLIEKALRVWYVSFFVLSRVRILRHVNVRKSKFGVVRVCPPLQGNCFVVHGDVSRRMICWKKTFANSLVEDKASENVCEKFAVASKQNRTMIYRRWKSKQTEADIWQPEAAGRGLYTRFVKPDNSSASISNVLYYFSKFSAHNQFLFPILFRFLGDRKSIRDRKTHSLKLPLIISFKRFLVLLLRKVQDKMLKLNNTRIFMHVWQTERHTKTGDNVRKGATVRVNVDKKVLVGWKKKIIK